MNLWTDAANQEDKEACSTVAIVAWYALPAIIPQRGHTVGGIETTAWMLARWLAKHGDLCPLLIVRSARKLPQETIEGVRIQASVEPLASLRHDVSECVTLSPTLQIKQWNAKLLWQLPVLAIARLFRRPRRSPMTPDPRLVKLNPDIWIAMGVGENSAGVVATALSQDRPSLLMLRSNADIDERFLGDGTYRTKYGDRADACRYTIENASAIICQSEHQQRLLEQRFGIQGELVRNPIDCQVWHRPKTSPGDYVAWVGRYDDFHKRPALAFAVAKKCPALKFRMVVNPRSVVVEKTLRRHCPNNVELIDYIPHDQMPDFIRGCRLFLSTSSADYEGFPNVLLQAAAAGRWIVSMEDFDRFLIRSAAGHVCGGSVDDCAEAVLEGWHLGEDKPPDSVQAYLHKHHSPQSVVDKLAAILLSRK